MKRVLIVGAGFSGAVLARQLAAEGGVRSVVIDTRPHVGGNCHTERDAETGVMVHAYGPHIFNTSNAAVWQYVQKFGEFRPYTNRVKASLPQGVFSMPINLHTINQFFGLRLNPNEAREFLASKAVSSIETPANFEEQALKFIGEEIYHAFFYGYTKKQWGCEPRELPASILKRIPIRFNYDDNYYSTTYQGIPIEGYTEIVRRLLDHELIETRLGENYDPAMAPEFEHVFYTGPLDAWFGCSLGRLAYRSVYWNRIQAIGDYQGNAVINYPGMEVAHTRVHEHKHFTPWETHENTLAFVEFSKETEETDVPYYPKRRDGDKALLHQYLERAREQRGVTFLGRLATYRYMDMHHVIDEALEVSQQWLAARAAGIAVPVFPERPLL